MLGRSKSIGPLDADRRVGTPAIIKLNVEIMAAYDFAFAKAKYARSISAVEPIILDYRGIQIHSGRHPLLGRDVIPLTFISEKNIARY